MVYLVLELMEAGVAPEKIIQDYYPRLRKESIQAALHFAAELMKEREFVPYTNA